MPSTELNFRTTHRITGLNVIDGDLYWTDDRNEPRKIEIEKFKAADHSSGTTAIFGRSFQDRDITVIRPHPTDGIGVTFVSDGSVLEDIQIGSTDAPSVETFPPRNIDTTRAELRGFSFDPGVTRTSDNEQLVIEGTGSLSERGFYFGTSTTASQLASTGTNLQTSLDGNTFEEFASDLEPETEYSVVAYATNEYGTTFGEVLMFTTLSLIREEPQTFSLAATNVGSTSFTMNGRIANPGGDVIAGQGFIWGTQNTLVGLQVSGTNQAVRIITNPFSADLDGLDAGQDYFYAAYCTNSIDTDYGAVIRATTTAASIPVLGQTNTHNLLALSSSVSSVVSDNGGSPITSRGFLWSASETTAAELIADGTNTPETSSLLGGPSFGAELEPLNESTTYHFIAYAINENGTGYSNVVEFTTQTIVLLGPPSVSTRSVNLEGTPGSQTAIRVNGNVTLENGAPILQRGFFLGTSSTQSGLIATGTRNDLSGATGLFGFTYTGLIPGTTYYAMAFATNSEGTAYGGILNLATPAIEAVPLLGSVGTVFTFTDTTANLSGNVRSSVGSTLTDRGFIVGTDQTLADLITNPLISIAPIVLGAMAHVATGLTADTTYYYVAYGVNNSGTGYSSVQSFRTGPATGVVPTVATLPVVSTTSVNAELIGSVTSDGGRSTTLRGFRWGLATLPDSSFTGATAGTGVVTVSSSAIAGTGYRLISSNSGTNAVPNTTYKYVAFATNSAGIGVGGVLTFTTDAAATAPSVTTSAAVNIESDSATLRGSITANNGGTIDLDTKGFYWSTTNPANAAALIANGTFQISRSPGGFLTAELAITPGTTYYYTAVASNTLGTIGNGSVLSLQSVGAGTGGSLNISVSDSTVDVDVAGDPTPEFVTVTVNPSNASFSVDLSRWSDRSPPPAITRRGNRLEIGSSDSTSTRRTLDITVSHSQNSAITETITLSQSSSGGGFV